MKRLITLRHAKSGWEQPAARDFDRALNAKGRRAAEAMGRHLRDEQVTFDQVMSSPAVRCVETLESFAEGYGRRITPSWDRRLYLASTANLLEVVQEAPAGAASLLLVGHNPGIEELVIELARAADEQGIAAIGSLEEKYPTASVVELEFDTDDWGQVDEGRGRLIRFVRPRDLDPALGPEEA